MTARIASTIQQYWIEMNKAPTEESRAGFNIALQGGAFCSVGGCNSRNSLADSGSHRIMILSSVSGGNSNTRFTFIPPT